MNIFRINFIFFFIFYFLIGFFIYKDYGIGIEEHFQRQNGYYWLKKILSLFNLDDLNSLAIEKYNTIRTNDPYLPDPEIFNYYGIVFDTSAAFIELILKLNESKLYFEIRHLLNFFFFFFSSFFFFFFFKKI